MYYDQLKRRVKQLLSRTGRNTKVTLLYNDGTEKTVGSLEAVDEITNDHNIVAIKCHDEAGQSLFSAMLQAELENGGDFGSIDELWD